MRRTAPIPPKEAKPESVFDRYDFFGGPEDDGSEPLDGHLDYILDYKKASRVDRENAGILYCLLWMIGDNITPDGWRQWPRFWELVELYSLRPKPLRRALRLLKKLHLLHELKDGDFPQPEFMGQFVYSSCPDTNPHVGCYSYSACDIAWRGCGLRCYDPEPYGHRD